MRRMSRIPAFEGNPHMTAVLLALRRLFPPLLVKRKLLVFVALLAAYGWAVYQFVEIEHLPHIDWGAEITIISSTHSGTDKPAHSAPFSRQLVRRGPHWQRLLIG
jgi:hypothetical protein